MSKCLLCLVNDATKKNSHVIPFFLIKEAISKEGETKRDYEITFSIGDDFVSTYFGRNVLPEKIQEVAGEEVAAEDLETQNPFSRDNILCPRCEKRLGLLEAKFERDIYSKLSAGKDVEFAKEGLKLSLLFAYSIFWRCSAINYNHFKLSEKVEKKLRNLLNDFLPDIDNELTEKLAAANQNYFPYCVITCYLATSKDEAQTGNLVKICQSRIPAFFVLNKTIFQFFEKEVHIKSSQDYRYGLARMMDNNEVFSLYLEGKYLVHVLSNEQRKILLSRIYDEAGQAKGKRISNLFAEGYKHFFKRNPPAQLTARYFQLLSERSKSQYTIYDPENLRDTAVALMIEEAARQGIKVPD